MSEFIVQIKCDNDAYFDNAEEMLADNLHAIADSLLAGNPQGWVHDYNGNCVGRFFFRINENNA